MKKESLESFIKNPDLFKLIFQCTNSTEKEDFLKNSYLTDIKNLNNDFNNFNQNENLSEEYSDFIDSENSKNTQFNIGKWTNLEHSLFLKAVREYDSQSKWKYVIVFF